MLVYVILQFFFIVNCQEKKLYWILQIGNISIVSVAAEDVELTYPIHDTRTRADVTYCMSSLVAWLQYFVHRYKRKIVY